jgi:hypothetical protein
MLDIRLAEGRQILAGRRTPNTGLAEEGRKVSAVGRMSGCGLVEEGRKVSAAKRMSGCGLAEERQVLGFQMDARYWLAEGRQVYNVWIYIEYNLG